MDKEYKDFLRKEQKTPRKNKKPQSKPEDEVADDENKENQSTKKELFPAEKDTSTSNPVYKQISRKNGFINKQDLSTLKRICKEENIDSSGKRDLVTKRLKQYYKVKLLREAGILEYVNRGFDYLVVIDFEATCEENKTADFPHEIIEFPAVLVDVVGCKIVSNWRRYVKPVINPVLSEFCVSLTGIQQDQVENALEFPQVLDEFNEWLTENRLGTEFTFGILTDGPFDIGRFFRLSCAQYSIPFPIWATRWVNLRKAFSNYYRQNSGGKDRAPGLQLMLSKIGLEFQGNPHCGLDDATNIARVAERLLRDGATFRVNERIEFSESKEDGKDRRLKNVAPVTKKESEDWLTQCKKNVNPKE